MIILKNICILVFVFCLLSTSHILSAMEEVDHDLYADLLKKYVHKGVVDYHGFQNEEAKLDRYLKILEDTNTKTLPRNERFAFYVNAYNAWTIKLTLSKYPDIKSIKDLGGFLQSPWKKKICRIDGDIPGFFRIYAQGEFKRELEKNKDKIKIRYLDYDWSLNGE